MEMNLHVVSDNQFKSCSDSEVVINTKSYTSNIIVTNNLVSPLSAKSCAEVTLLELTPLLDFKPDIILFTTLAHKFIYPSAAIIHHLQQHAIGFEIMSLPALCRTYNFLIGEGRKVGAVICFIESK